MSDDFEISDLDGIPVFWRDVPGPFRMAMGFRVGSANETVPQRGLTHVCEHLSIASVAEKPPTYNGFVEPGRTVFFASGAPSEVATYLSGIAAFLADPDLRRLEREARVLRTEAQHNGSGLVDGLLHARYGASGFGIGVYEEFALNRPSPEAVHRWAVEHFTKSDAVFWATGEPPAFDVALPDGVPSSIPRSVPLDEERPFFSRYGDLLGLGYISQRRAAGALFAFVFDRRLRSELRDQLGVSYTVGAHELRIPGVGTHASFFADAAPHRAQEAVDGFFRALESVAAGSLTDSEREAFFSGLNHSREHPEWHVGLLDSASARHLASEPMRTVAEWEAEMAALTAEDVLQEAGRALADAVVVVPADASVNNPHFRPRDEWHEEVVTGPTFKPRRPQPSNPAVRLVASREGVMVAYDDRRRLTVRPEDAVARLAWSDGTRALIHRDGTSVTVNPDVWRNGREAASTVDVATPTVRMAYVGRRSAAPGDPAVVSRENMQLTPAHTALALAVVIVLVCMAGPVVVAIEEGDFAPLLVVVAIVIPVALALSAVAAALSRRRARRFLSGEPARTYDQASNHFGPGFPSDVSAHGAYMVGGLALGCLVDRGLVNEWFQSESGDDLGAYCRGEITGPQLYREWGGVLATDMLTLEGNGFLAWYFRSRYSADLKKVMGRELPTWYHLPDTPETHGRLLAAFDSRIASWRRNPWRRFVYGRPAT